MSDTPDTLLLELDKVSNLEPELIIYRAWNGWLVQHRSETDPEHWPIWVVEDDDMKLLDAVADVLGLS